MGVEDLVVVVVSLLLWQLPNFVKCPRMTLEVAVVLPVLLPVWRHLKQTAAATVCQCPVEEEEEVVEEEEEV